MLRLMPPSWSQLMFPRPRRSSSTVLRQAFQLFLNVTGAWHLNNMLMMIIMLQEPDDGAIPSQFPISEDIQFCQLLQEATDFFGIEEEKMDQFFLVDHKTRELRWKNPLRYQKHTTINHLLHSFLEKMDFASRDSPNHAF